MQGLIGYEVKKIIETEYQINKAQQAAGNNYPGFHFHLLLILVNRSKTHFDVWTFVHYMRFTGKRHRI
jgi:hypothetical protein